MKDTITIDGIKYTRTSEKLKSIEKELFNLKKVLLETIPRMEQAEEEALEIYNEMKEGGLNFNSVESEGNLRGIRYAKSVFDCMIEGLDLSTEE